MSGAELEPIETIAVPIDVASDGPPHVVAYLVDRGYSYPDISSALGIEISTARQYASDVRQGRR